MVVPSEDIGPTAAMRDLYARNLQVNKAEGFTERTPLISHVLNSGLSVADYVVGSHGPMIYDRSNGTDWIAGEVWALLDRFTRLEPLQHPKSRRRDTASYRCPLWKVHKRLAEDEISEL